MKIYSSELKGKKIEHYDKEKRYRIGEVKMVHRDGVSVRLPYETVNRRVNKKHIIGQITHSFQRDIVWEDDVNEILRKVRKKFGQQVMNLNDGNLKALIIYILVNG